jgi:hypothetical protein
MWTDDFVDSALVRITMKAKITAIYPLDASYGGKQYQLEPAGMVVGPDKRFWMTTNNADSSGDGFVAAITTAGSATVFPTPGESPSSSHLAVGPDGNLWVPLSSHIARITTTGTVSQYPYGQSGSGYANGVTVGPDGDVWFTEGFTGYVGKIQPGSNAPTEYKIPDSTSGQCHLGQIVNGGDGNLYTVGGNCILADVYSLVAVTATGQSTAVALPETPSPYGIMLGPDGNVWIPVYFDGSIMVYNLKKKTLTTIPPPSPVTCSAGVLATGPDANVWEVGIAKGFSVYLRKTLTVTPTTVTLSGVGQTATLQASETGNPALTATSSKTSVATVAPGQSFDSFVVTAQSAGKATITVKDSKKNYFLVPVTVQ